ncbi:histidine kinase [Streptomyces sp. NPDC048506]|uniref:sensor histidine kinase n=1 Tax=Streptomyces sp. NPDC048506 TaxID=3155028 RepID=UPI0034308D8B
MLNHLRPGLWAQPQMVDPAVAVGCFALAAPVAFATAYHLQTSITWSVGGLALSCLPLLVRSRWPVRVVAATLAVNITLIFLLPIPGPSFAATAFALYTVATRTDRRTAWRVLACAVAALVATSQISRPGLADLWQNVAQIAGLCLAAASGDAVRSRRKLLSSAIERAERAERTKEEEARQRVTEERLRIARELHDVIAHHITLVNAQAGVAHHLMRTDPDHAYQALERIRDTSRSALDELRATVGLLRHNDAPEIPREPAPGLVDLDALLDSFHHTGLTVALERTGSADELPPITDLTAYRIIQEALTNTRKHAGPVTARLHLDYRTDALHLTIEDDGLLENSREGGPVVGPAGTHGTGTGHGMIGMRERAKAAGGALTAGPRPGGGFRIAAELPLHARRKGRP